MSGYTDIVTYHKYVNGYTGRTYYSAAGEDDEGCEETHWVLNPEVFYGGDSSWYLEMATYAVGDVEYDEETGTWSTAEGAEAADPTCVDGAYNVYTLKKEFIEDVIKENASEDETEAVAVWYVEPLGNEILLDGTLYGDATYTVYPSNVFKPLREGQLRLCGRERLRGLRARQDRHLR